MYQRAFATVSDDNYFPGLWVLLNSIFAYYGCDYRVFVVGHHLSDSAVVDLHRHPLGRSLTLIDDKEFAYQPVRRWEAKQCILSHLCGQVATMCMLDADLVLLSRLDDVFGWAEEGLIVSSQDGHQEAVFDHNYGVYGEALVGTRMPYFNSGFLCFNLLRHWDLAALWEFTSRFAAYSPSAGQPYGFAGHGDQGILNAIAALLGKRGALKLLPQELWCNSAGWSGDETLDMVGGDGIVLEVLHRRSGDRQRLLHSTGPKWWTSEGRAFFGNSGDVMKCFEHFAALHPRSDEKLASSWNHRPGTLRYVGDISRQDAQVLAEHAAVSHRILEFEHGGSTQVLAQLAPPGASLTAVETDPTWVVLTQQHLRALPIRADMQFILYSDWRSLDVGLIDMAFVDGVDHLRLEFADRAWGFLRVGGVLLIHDTRRATDVNYTLELVKRYHLEVEHVELNVRASNITVIHKKIAEPYVNWNAVEDLEVGLDRRPPLELGQDNSRS